jgi:serine protease Do
MTARVFLRRCWLPLVATACLPVRPLPTLAQQPNDFLRSSPQVMHGFAPVVAGPSLSTVRVRCDGKDAALGTITGANGWIVTKATLLRGKIACCLKDGRELPATLVGVHQKLDLAMLKVEATGLTPVVWADGKVATVGRWAVSVGTGTDPVAIGVISVAPRPFRPGDQPPEPRPPDSGHLGVEAVQAEGGSRITSVDPKSPAAEAGIKVGDLITHLNKEKFADKEALITAMARQKAGAEVTLTLLRGKDQLEVTAKLARYQPSRGEMQSQMGSLLSERRGGFPSILQHDTVLAPTDCGGPLVDLDGKALGVNIARAGRVESYAIPAEVVREVLADLMAGNLPPTTKDD